jgi:hypothetical protein
MFFWGKTCIVGPLGAVRAQATALLPLFGSAVIVAAVAVVLKRKEKVYTNSKNSWCKMNTFF